MGSINIHHHRLFLLQHGLAGRSLIIQLDLLSHHEAPHEELSLIGCLSRSSPHCDGREMKRRGEEKGRERGDDEGERCYNTGGDASLSSFVSFLTLRFLIVVLLSRCFLVTGHICLRSKNVKFSCRASTVHS